MKTPNWQDMLECYLRANFEGVPCVAISCAPGSIHLVLKELEATHVATRDEIASIVGAEWAIIEREASSVSRDCHGISQECFAVAWDGQRITTDNM